CVRRIRTLESRQGRADAASVCRVRTHARARRAGEIPRAAPLLMSGAVAQLSEAIRAASARKQALRIRGGGTKDFYGGELRGDVLDTRVYAGVVEYEPTELVITARSGTLLAEIEAAMREQGQMLAFEPPSYGQD